MNAVELKDYIIENNKIEEILESLGCHKIKQYKNDIRCALPDHHNGTSVRIKLKTLKVKTFDDDFAMVGDIFTFIMKLKKLSFVESIKYIHNQLGIEYKYSPIKKNDKIDILSIFKKAKKISNPNNFYKEDLTVFNELGEEYIELPHIDWIREGILPFACRKFHIGFDLRSKRILIPHRLWCGEENDFVGIIGRTTIPNYDLLDIPKYCSMRKERYPKTMNIYGLQENYESIQDAGYVVVFEAEKSVLKRYSRKDGTGVAVCCHEISPEQERILISLDVDIVIAMDRGISLFDIRALCEKFYGIRKVYYIYDKYDVILKDKDSPADLPNDLYNYMFNYKTLYDKNEHDEYIRELKYIENLEKRGRLNAKNT